MADQLSVLAIEDIIGAHDIVQLMPDINQNRLPALRQEQSEDTRAPKSNNEDTTLLVKMFIELKARYQCIEKGDWPYRCFDLPRGFALRLSHLC